MARARNIKPGFFKNELLAEMPPETRLLFVGLWCLADREGRFEDRPKKIKMELFPCDSFSIEDSLAMLAKDGFLLRYEVDGKRYAQVVNFTKHQMPHHKEVPSEIPAPPGCAQVTRHAYDVPAKVREEVFARDGGACLKCGSLESLSLDHIKPLGSGGDNSINNLQTLCTSCNSSKGNTTKDYRRPNVGSTLSQHQAKQGAHCPSESGFSDSLIPDSPILDSVPDGTGGDAAKPAADMTRDELWTAGKSLLEQAGLPAKQCGSFVGKLVKDYGDQIVVDAVRAAVVARPADPVEYLKATCMRSVGQRAPVNKQEALERRNRSVADAWANEGADHAAV
ncbi:MAG: HNH endonuclease [Acidovorax sp.]|nr:HNH endonuclease [Acidovorax sp.]